MAKIGFETNRRIVRVMGNKPITATVGGKTYRYRSTGEYMWAQYLQFLQDNEQIVNWYYEPKPPFYFLNEKTAPVQYTPDFYVCPVNKPNYYQEFKRSSLDGRAVRKLQRMQKHHPNVQIELVMMGMPKKETNRMRTAKKYIKDNRIVDATAIFKQLGKMIKSGNEFIEELDKTTEGD